MLVNPKVGWVVESLGSSYIFATMGWYNPLVLEQVHPDPCHVQGSSLQSHGHLVYEKINFENGITNKDKIKLPFCFFIGNKFLYLEE